MNESVSGAFGIPEFMPPVGVWRVWKTFMHSPISEIRVGKKRKNLRVDTI
jgi:hypothetical protein